MKKHLSLLFLLAAVVGLSAKTIDTKDLTVTAPDTWIGSLTVRGEIFLKIIGLQFGKVNFLFVPLLLYFTILNELQAHNHPVQERQVLLYPDNLPQKRRQAVFKDCQETRQRDFH